MRILKRLSAAAVVFAMLALPATSGAGAGCRTPEPYTPARGDQRHTAGPVTVRHGPSWTDEPGRHAGIESGSTYLYADGSEDGALLELSAQGISMHAGVPDGGLIDFCLST